MLETPSAPELSASLDVSPEAPPFEVEPVALAVKPVSSPDAEVDGGDGDGPQASTAATHHGDAQRVTDNGLDQRRSHSRIAAVLVGSPAATFGDAEGMTGDAIPEILA